MYNFQVSFNEFRNREKRVLAMKTKNSYTRHYGSKNCIRSGGKLRYYYVTDIYGFAVLHTSFNKLELYYFDFSREYVQYIEIPIVFDYVSEFMIYKRTIRTVTQNGKNYHCKIDAIYIVDKNEWFHVTSASNLPISGIVDVMSNNMFIGYDSEEEERLEKLSSLEVLYIDSDALTCKETIVGKFIAASIPNQFRNKGNFKVIGIFNSILVFTEKEKLYVGDAVIYFLIFEGLEIESTKIIDLTPCLKQGINIFNLQDNFFFLQELGKGLLTTDTNMIVVIDMILFKMTQILELLISCTTYSFEFYCSKGRKELFVMSDSLHSRDST